jgi:hypothetical protein
MNDAAIQKIIKDTLVAGLVTRGVAGVTIKQGRQPRQATVPTAPTIFYTYKSRKRWGWPSNSDKVNDDGTITTTRAQVIHTTFQVSAIAPVSAADPLALTSSDLNNLAADIMTSEPAIASYVAQDCNVFRIQDLPGLWFQDNNAQNVLWASFDIIFTHKDVSVSSSPAINDFNGTVGTV